MNDEQSGAFVHRSSFIVHRYGHNHRTTGNPMFDAVIRFTKTEITYHR